MQFLVAVDQLIFQWLNGVWTHPIADQMFTFITSFQRAAPLFALLAAYLLWRYRMRAFRGLLAVGLSVAIGDQIATRIIKPTVHRDRPTQALGADKVRLLVPHQSSPSFVSNHATNMYAVATALSIFLPEVAGLIFMYAFLVAYSRVYVGVHFPFDVLGGAILGWTCGILGTNIFLRLEIWSYKLRRRKPQIPTDVPRRR